MTTRQTPLLVVASLLALLASGAVQAQKRMPVRTQEVPDTESGRPAASAERPTFKGRLLIYGPQSLPVTPPPEHVTPPSQEEAKAAPPPAPAQVAAPVAAPVITPVAPVPPPVAIPIGPAPPPSTPVAAPKPAPAPPPPVQVAAPEPKPAPAPVQAVAPEPKPAPPAAPAVVAAPPVREPVVRIEPPKPAPPPAPARQNVALAAPSSAAAATPEAPVAIEPKVIESIFTCLAPGLPQDWKRAWVEITDQGAGKEKASKFRFSNLRGDDEGEPLVPCNAPELTRRILSLNEKLAPDRRTWTRALLVIDSDGEYELSYEYPNK